MSGGLISLIRRKAASQKRLSRYRAKRSGEPDQWTVDSDTFLFLSHSRFVVAVNRRSNVDCISICHGTVDCAMLCAVATLYWTLYINDTQQKGLNRMFSCIAWTY